MASKPYPRNLKPSGQIKNIKGDQKGGKKKLANIFVHYLQEVLLYHEPQPPF
jgi:hypothetical protein